MYILKRLVFWIILLVVIISAGCSGPSSSGKDESYLHDPQALANRMIELEKRTGKPMQILDLSIATSRPSMGPKKSGQEINLISLFFADSKNPGKSGRILYDHNNKDVPVLPGEMKFSSKDLFKLEEVDLKIVPQFVAAAEEKAKAKGITNFSDEELHIKRDNKSGEITLRLVIKGFESEKSMIVTGNKAGQILKER